jgi:DNA-binding Lrp family transcriptional regulator
MDEKVSETFAKLKQLNSSYELKHIKGHHYVYISFSRWDAEAGRSRKVSIYKGKISEDGAFTPMQKHRHGRPRSAEAPHETGQPAAAPAEPLAEEFRIRESSRKYESALLTALSMNGRISLPVLGKMLDLSVTATDWQVKSLERRYGIRYLPEIDVTKFGYMQFFLAVKFLDKSPPADDLKKLLQKEPRIQTAMMLKGEFDVLIYVLAKSVEELNNDVMIGISKAMGDYDCTWTTIPFYEDYGFMPLRDEFIDFLKDSLLAREYAVLRELNRDGKTEFGEIDKKYGTEEGRASYSYHKLRKEGKIKRITISLQKLPLKYIGIVMETLTNQLRFEKNKGKLLYGIIEKSESQIDRYLFVCDTVNPYGLMFFLPVFNNSDLDEALGKLSGIERGVKFATLVVINVLFGDFCYRKFDSAYSIQQKMLESAFGAEKVQKIDYEESGRKKTYNIKLDMRGARIADNSEDANTKEPS